MKRELETEAIAEIGEETTVKLLCLNTKQFYTKLKEAKSHTEVLLNLQ